MKKMIVKLLLVHGLLLANTSHPLPHTFSSCSVAWLCGTPEKKQTEATEVVKQERLAYWWTMAVAHSRSSYTAPVVACMPPQTRKGTCSGAEQLFGMYNICIHHTVMQDIQRRKMNKIDRLLCFEKG